MKVVIFFEIQKKITTFADDFSGICGGCDDGVLKIVFCSYMGKSYTASSL